MKIRLLFKNKTSFVLAVMLSLTTVNFLSAQSKQVGTLIGTNGSWNNNPSTVKEAAVDGDIATFFDAPSSTAYVGYDYGANGVSLSSVKFVPRPDNNAKRLSGNKIYGSNTGYEGENGTLLYTFPLDPSDYNYSSVIGVYTEFTLDSPTDSYQYIYMYSTNACNVAEIEFWGTSTTLGVVNINTNKDELVLHPNPSIDNFSIKLGNENLKNTIDIKVYNMLGELVLYKTVKANSNLVKVNHSLSSGVYVVNFNGKSTKIIVK